MTDPNRKHLPYKRRTKRWKLRVGGHKVLLSADEYPDGTPGAVWVDMHKQGAFTRHAMHVIAQLTSLCLQFGVPLRKLVKAFRDQDFEPKGAVEGHPRIDTATSLVDLVFHVLELEYLQEK